MKIFTARDLSRSTASVLATSDVDGVATIRTRDGRTYELRPVIEPPRNKESLAAAIDRHLAKIKALKAKYNPPPITKAQWEAIDCSMTERPLLELR